MRNPRNATRSSPPIVQLEKACTAAKTQCNQRRINKEASLPVRPCVLVGENAPPKFRCHVSTRGSGNNPRLWALSLGDRLEKGREGTPEASVGAAGSAPRGTGCALDSNSGLESRAGETEEMRLGSQPQVSPPRGLLRVSLIQSGDSAPAKVAGNLMKAISIRVPKASMEDAHQAHTPPYPGVLGPNWERDHKPQHPVSDWGICYRSGWVVFF